MLRITSKMVSPASTWPPCEWISTRIGRELSALSPSSCALTLSASALVISPKIRTVRESNSLSVTRVPRRGGSGSGGALRSKSVMLPGCAPVPGLRPAASVPGFCPQLSATCPRVSGRFFLPERLVWHAAGCPWLDVRGAGWQNTLMGDTGDSRSLASTRRLARVGLGAAEGGRTLELWLVEVAPAQVAPAQAGDDEIGRASCRERG